MLTDTAILIDCSVFNFSISDSCKLAAAATTISADDGRKRNSFDRIPSCCYTHFTTT